MMKNWLHKGISNDKDLEVYYLHIPGGMFKFVYYKKELILVLLIYYE
jgi:hypothetical protein